jgi:hypothetical protein
MVEIYDDENQVGWLCTHWHPSVNVRCKRPRQHKGKHQNKEAGIQWWWYSMDAYKTIEI